MPTIAEKNDNRLTVIYPATHSMEDELGPNLVLGAPRAYSTLPLG